jgi:hypothetical protein
MALRGAVIGGGKRQAFHAPSLACGGFAANRDRRRATGAATSFMDFYQGHGHVTVNDPGRLGFGRTSLGATETGLSRKIIGLSELAAYVLAAPGGNVHYSTHAKFCHRQALAWCELR